MFGVAVLVTEAFGAKDLDFDKLGLVGFGFGFEAFFFACCTGEAEAFRAVVLA